MPEVKRQIPSKSLHPRKFYACLIFSSPTKAFNVIITVDGSRNVLGSLYQ